MTTVVYQSFRERDVPPWVQRCIESVREWAVGRGWAYRFYGDDIFDRLPRGYREAAAGRAPVLTDLGRLLLARELLASGFRRTVWLDADVLVFDPGGFDIPVTEGDYAFGREIWVQGQAGGELRVYRNVHNALAVFTRGNPMLDFYVYACERIVGRIGAGGPPQIVGPKLLKVLHGLLDMPLLGDVAMLSPRVLSDLAGGRGAALDRLARETVWPVHAANLCLSLAGGEHDGVRVDDALLEAVTESLLGDPRPWP